MRLVLCSCPPEAAERIVHAVVDEGFAAAVNVVEGVERTSAGDGVETVRETLLLIQTVRDALDPLFERIAELHPSDAPPLVSLQINAADQGMTAWVSKKKKEGAGGGKGEKEEDE